MAATNPFTWGSNGQKASPSSVKKYADIAAALASKTGAPQNIGEGLNRVGEALLYNSANDRAAAGEAEGAASRKAVLDALLGNPDPSMMDIAGAMGNEWIAADPGSQAVVQAMMGQENQQNNWAREDAQQQAQWAREDNDPLRKMQLEQGQIELEQLRNPQAAAPDYGFDFAPDGTLIRTDSTSGEVAPLGNYPRPAAAPLVTVNTGETQDGALNSALSKKEGESWAGYKDAATVSASNAQDFEILGELMQLAPQGPITGRLAQTFPGFSAAGDAANSIIKRIAPTLRAPGSGATSDIEYDGMLKSLPSLAQTPEANQMVLSIMQAKAAVNMERGKIITSYQNGEIGVDEARRSINELDSRSVLTPDMRRALLGVGGDGGVAPAQDQPMSEGTVIENDSGQQLILRNGQWEPVT